MAICFYDNNRGVEQYKWCLIIKNEMNFPLKWENSVNKETFEPCRSVYLLDM